MLKTHKIKQEARKVLRFLKGSFKNERKNKKINSTMCPDMLFCFPLSCCCFLPPRKISKILSLLNKNLEGKLDLNPSTVKLLCAPALQCFSYFSCRSQPTMWQVCEARKGGVIREEAGRLRARARAGPQLRALGPSQGRRGKGGETYT